MAIVVDLQLGRSLAAVGPHDAVVDMNFLTRRRVALVTIPVILPIISARRTRLPAHVDSAVNQAVIECRRLWALSYGHSWGDSEIVGD